MGFERQIFLRVRLFPLWYLVCCVVLWCMVCWVTAEDNEMDIVENYPHSVHWTPWTNIAHFHDFLYYIRHCMASWSNKRGKSYFVSQREQILCQTCVVFIVEEQCLIVDIYMCTIFVWHLNRTHLYNIQFFGRKILPEVNGSTRS